MYFDITHITTIDKNTGKILNKIKYLPGCNIERDVTLATYIHPMEGKHIFMMLMVFQGMAFW